jgi:hypothetical protein
VRPWTQRDTDIGNEILRMAELRTPFPGGSKPEETILLTKASVYAFVPRAVAEKWHGPLSLHGLGHAMQAAGMRSIQIGKVFTEKTITPMIAHMIATGSLEIARRGADATMVIDGVPMTLVNFDSFPMPMHATEDLDLSVHPATMIEFTNLAAMSTQDQGPGAEREPDADLGVPIGVVENGDDDVLDFVPVFGAVYDGQVPVAMHVEAQTVIKKAYERKGFHGDDPDERDAGGRFARKGTGKPDARTPAPAPSKPKVGQYVPMLAEGVDARRNRRRRRAAATQREQRARQAFAAQQPRQAATASSAWTAALRADPAAQAGEAARAAARAAPRGQARSYPRPKRPAGSMWIPSSMEPASLLDLDRSESVAFVVDPSEEFRVWLALSTMVQQTMRSGEATPNNQWRVRDVEALKLASPTLAGELADAEEMQNVAFTTQGLRDVLTSTRPMVFLPESESALDLTIADVEDAAFNWVEDPGYAVRLVDSVKVESDASTITVSYDQVPPGFAEHIRTALRRRFGNTVAANVTSTYDVGGRAVPARSVRLDDHLDKEKVSGFFLVDAKNSDENGLSPGPLWIVLDRTKPVSGRTSASQSAWYVSGDPRALGDDAATVYADHSVARTVGWVAEQLGMDPRLLKYPASLPVRVVVVEHQGGTS